MEGVSLFDGYPENVKSRRSSGYITPAACTIDVHQRRTSDEIRCVMRSSISILCYIIELHNVLTYVREKVNAFLVSSYDDNQSDFGSVVRLYT